MSNSFNKKYDNYDLLLMAIHNNYTYKAAESRNIIFTHFNPRKKSHLLLLKMAEIDNIRSFDSPIPTRNLFLKANPFKRLIILMGRESRKYYLHHIPHNTHGSRCEINCEELMSFTDKFRIHHCNGISWEEVYDEYYATKGKRTK